ncbi:larval cuticle protein A2B-like [Anticarsia gemmatalis]|uniref:larval cuticle protein A2B-like n=1 Tax=Anticarsia gemmatalis TaxID=129554 RepID=UPI003F77668F
MFRISLLLCVAPTAFGIIVRDPPPSPNDYKYSYDIQDPTTGDSKSQHEVRQGDVVTGAYTVVGPDGTKRTVEYTADAQHGFKAVVSEEPVHPVTVTHAPITVSHPPIESFDYNTILQHASSPRPHPYYPQVTPVQLQPRIYQDQQKVYFTPQNEIEPRQPFTGGHYFIPANDKY